MKIRPASSPADFADARRLFAEYAASLSHDLCFQSFSKELETLEAMYGAPGGTLLVAEMDGVTCGCVALRPLADGVCEMKRLYLQPQFRGDGRGLALAHAILEEGRRIGYRKIRLDTLPEMGAAIQMYRRLGFREIEPYYPNPIVGALYMEFEFDHAAPE